MQGALQRPPQDTPNIVIQKKKLIATFKEQEKAGPYTDWIGGVLEGPDWLGDCDPLPVS